jgi:DNA repair ATPase RecN
MSIVQGVGGAGNFSGQINKIIQEMNETKKIVQDVFKKLEEFKATTDKAIAKEKVKKAEEKIEKLRKLVKQVAPRLTQALAKIEEQIDELKKQLQMPV